MSESTTPPEGSFLRRWLRRLLRLGLGLVVLLLVGVAAFAFWVNGRFRASLPELEGSHTVAGIEQEVTIERDALGVATLRGASRGDVAFATGFVHGQDRFFQMDLSRKQAAGELAEIFGPRALRLDRDFRRHRFRTVAREVLAAMPPERRALVNAYVAGVNAGLGSLEGPPPEYFVLRTEPREWMAEDTVLIVLVMFLLLQDDDGEDETIFATMQEHLPASLFDFLTPLGDSWDAPMVGEALEVPPLPEPSVVDLRQGPPAQPATLPGTPPEEEPEAASNAWAIGPERTQDGSALMAVDTHMGLAVPNSWYRARFVWTGVDGTEHDVVGVTLPGAPVMVLGSNSHVAWGFTNARIDGSDLVRIVRDPSNPDAYLTPEGSEPFGRYEELLRTSSGEEEETLEVLTTRWGPLLEDDFAGRPQALRWITQDPDAVNLAFLELETSRGVEEAMALAQRSGLPAQNLVLADGDGHIGWTIAGRLPVRRGLDGRLPSEWSDGERGWDGLLPPEEVPAVLDPPSGMVWTANNRPVGGEALERLGLGGSYVVGARARQVRDRLLDLDGATPQDMLDIQLDDRSFFLDRWQTLLLEALEADDDELRGRYREAVESWNGHASVGSVGYRLIRETRDEVARRALEPLLAPCYEVDEEFEYLDDFKQIEGPLWVLVTERPEHLLDPAYESWQALLLAAVDTVLEKATAEEAPLEDYTWGARNTAKIRHFFGQVLPFLGPWLNMPEEPLPGDRFVPRVQGPDNGASLRMVVSPGREAEGIFHMPTGQSGHFLSPHFADSHGAWARGEATPLLPGQTVHTLVLSKAP